MTVNSIITDDMKRAVGVWRLPQFPAQAVGRWGIGRYLDALGDSNPLWQDDEYARKTPWGGIVAPPIYVEVFNPVFLNARGGWTRAAKPPFSTLSSLETLDSEEYELLLPSRLGDLISVEGVLSDVREGAGTPESGRRLLMTLDKEYRNQKGQTVARAKATTSTSEKQVKDEKAPSQMPIFSAPVEDTVPGSRQVNFDEVSQGAGLPSFVRTMTTFRIYKWAGATGDFSLEHLDYPSATREMGLPDIVAHRHLMGAYLALLVTNWIGGRGVLKKHSVKYLENVYPGHVLTVSGTVTRKFEQDGQHMVEIEGAVKTQSGKTVASGKSLASLPAAK